MFEFDLSVLPDDHRVADATFYARRELASGSSLSSTVEFFGYTGHGVANLADLEQMDNRLGVHRMWDVEHYVDATDVVADLHIRQADYAGILARSWNGSTTLLSKEIADSLDHYKPRMTIQTVPVPEPGVISLLIGAAVALAIWPRRRQGDLRGQNAGRR